MIRPVLLAILVFCAPVAATSQSDVNAAQSVVQIRCFPSGGETKATGFIWPEPGYMVTALHAVAGCENGIVLSEHAGLETQIDRIVAVDLEPDLALVKLVDGFDLPPLEIARDTPSANAAHFVWGYPMATEQMVRDNVRFSAGLTGPLTTLGRAYSHEDLLKLYRTQEYPTRDTQILRVASLLQHGQSGAPILDAQGRLVAIADGGLLGGWRGMNWSIPAHLYLPSLPTSEDDVPNEASRSALLMSSYVVRNPKIVYLGPDPDASSSLHGAGVYHTIGQVALGDVLLDLDSQFAGDVDWMFEELDGFVPEAAWNSFTFDVMQNDETGVRITLPTQVALGTHPQSGALQAVSTDGAAAFAEIYLEADSFEAAREQGLDALRGYFASVPEADTLPELLPPSAVHAALEYVNHAFFFETTNGNAAFDVMIQINGPVFSARVAHRDRHPDDMSDADWMDYLMMALAALELNSFEDRFIPEEWIEIGAPEPVAPEPEISALTLVRRVPLADVAAGFVSDRVFNWKRDLVYLKENTRDQAAYDALRFDVYEDRATGATVAVPEGLELTWNEELNAAEGIASNGRLRLAIAIHTGETFDDVTGENVLGFLEGLTDLAYWDDLGPANCDPDVDLEAQRAQCWGYFAGTDRRTGEFSDIYLGLTAQQNVFLGTSVYIVGDEADLTPEEIVAYRMMLIGAEYLSDFAVK